MNLNQYIDHTLLKATATSAEIKKLCTEAKKYNFYAVCVNGCYVSLAKEELKSTHVKVAAVIGFPLGAMASKAKVTEAIICVEEGADEIDMVINIGMLKEGNHQFVEEEILAIKKAIGSKVLKVIIETCYLTDHEKRIACKLAMNAGADFVKTSTGFGNGGATLQDVILMKDIVGEALKIKVSGGIRDQEKAKEYIALGIGRIGTSSGINIVSNK